MGYKLDTRRLWKHYQLAWNASGTILKMSSGPWREISPEFCVLEFEPIQHRTLWTYVTLGMSAVQSDPRLELHMVSMRQDRTLVELLTATAHYHATGEQVALGHSVNLGRSWQDESPCTFGLVSLPYLDGPELENFEQNGDRVKCLWLIPITPQEVRFKVDHGLEALEQRFDQIDFRYADPDRKSVV